MNNYKILPILNPEFALAANEGERWVNASKENGAEWVVDVDRIPEKGSKVGVEGMHGGTGTGTGGGHGGWFLLENVPKGSGRVEAVPSH